MSNTKTDEERKIIFSQNVEKYTLGGWLRGVSGKLILYEDELVFKHGFTSFKSDIVFKLKDTKIELTKVTGFINAGLHITDNSGKCLKVYALNRKDLEPYLKEYIK